MKNRSAFNQIMHFWPLVAAVLAVATAVGGASVRISSTEEKTAKLQETVDVQAQRLARLEEAMTAIPEIQKDIKKLLERSR